jgi:predicted acyl esterase
MKRNKPVTGRYQIIISQGGHCAGEDLAIQLEWFDTWVKGIKTGMDQTQRPVHVHEVISNNWINTTYYPVVPSYTQYFLNPYGQLSTADKEDNTQETIAWGQPGANTTVQYDGPVLPTGGTLAGPISASVSASSTTANLELIATVQLVTTDGTVTELSHGAVLSSLSANDEDRLWSDDNGTPVRPYGAYNHDSFVTAGKVQQYEWAMQPIFAHIPPGAKLRLVFTTQTPTALCQPILGTDACYPTTPQAATLGGGVFTIYHHTKQGSSSINLPMLPANCWSTAATGSDPYWANDTIVHGANAPCQLGKTVQNP